MASTGFTLAGTGANSTSIGTEAWTSTGNITAQDGSVSQGAPAKDEQMQYLVASNFGFAIPTGSTIDGIEIRFRAACAGSGGACSVLTNVVVGKSNGTLGNDLSNGIQLTASLTNYTYGNSTQKWGLSWTAAEINASTFQVRISFNADNVAFSAAGDPQVDAMWINVHYTLPPDQDQIFIIG